MNCNKTKRLMLHYIDNTLNTNDAVAFDEHISSCSKCSKEFKQIQQIYGLIDAEKKEFVFNPAISEKVIAKISEHIESYTVLFSPKRYAFVATMAAAALFVGIVLGSLFTRIDSTMLQANSNQSIETLANEYFMEYDNNPYNYQFSDLDNN